MADDGVSNFFDQTPRKAASDEPPPAQSEDDYGRNVVSFEEAAAGPRKRVRTDWQQQWHMSTTGTPLPNLFNTMLALRHHPQLHSLIRFDEMANCIVLAGHIPGTDEEIKQPRPMTDVDALAIQEAIQVTGLRRVAKETVRDAIAVRAAEQRFHPVRDYLEALAWDGEKRIDKWLSYYLGVDPSDYTSTVGRLFLIALVARAMRPGCKVDYMLILEGPQGALKSSACCVLAGTEYFSDNLPDLSRGDAVRLSMHLRGKWLVEIAELSSFSKAEAHTLKEFITQTVERYTPKYGREEVREPRQCVFVGTTNEEAYLRDPTGARRFWPVTVTRVDLVALSQDRDQLLAEAVHEFRAGAQWWPDRDFEAAHIAPQQADRYEHDPWQEAVEIYLKTTPESRVTMTQILREGIGLETARFGTSDLRRVGSILKLLGWKMERTNAARFYVRPEISK